MGKPAPHFLPPYGRILKLVCLLLSLQCRRLGADNLPCAFLSVGLKLTFVVSLGPTDSVWPFFCMFTSRLPKLALDAIRSATGSHRVGGVCG